MPRIAPKSAIDRAKHQLTNMHPLLDGSLVLTPENLNRNWRFDEIDNDGDAVNLKIGMPESPDGKHLYLSSPNGDKSTLARQTTAPLPIDQSSVLLSEGYVYGSKPVVSEQFAAKIPPPDKPGTELEATGTTAGLTAGVYWVSWSLALKFGNTYKYTKMATPVQVTVVTTGNVLEVAVPGVDNPFGDLYIAFWLSPPGGTQAQMRLSNIIATYNKKTRLSNYRPTLRLAPTVNETYIGVPDLPRIVVESSPFNREAGNYNFAVSLTTSRGESNLSAISAGFFVDESNRYNSRFTLYPPLNTKHATGMYIYVRKNNVWYKAYQINILTGVDKPWNLTHHPYVYGNTGVETTVADMLVQSATPTKDSTGIDSPTAQLDTPVEVTQGVLAVGKYWVGCSYTVRGKETVLGDLVQVTVTAGNTLRVLLPHPTQKLHNAEFNETGPGGTAIDMVLPALPTGVTRTFEPGEVVINANTTDVAANEVIVSKPISVLNKDNQQRNIALQIEHEIAAWTSGILRTSLREYDANDLLLGEDILVDSLEGIESRVITATLAALPAPGEIGYRPSTAIIRLVHSLRGSAGKVMQARLRNRGIHPGRTAVRKRIVPGKGTALPANPKPPPNTPFPPGPSKGVEPPPTVPDPGPARTYPPPDRPLDNPHTLEYVANPVLNGGTYVSRTYNPQRYSIGVRTKITVNTMPTTEAKLVEVIPVAPGAAFGSIWLKANGDLVLRYAATERLLWRGIAATNILTLELAALGAGQNNGALVVNVSLGDVLVFYNLARIYDINYESVYISEVRAGLISGDGTYTVSNFNTTYDGSITYREYDPDSGKRINQLYMYFPANQPVRQDIGPRGYREACLPGGVYTAGVYARVKDAGATGVPARPFYIVARGTDSSGNQIEKEIGSIFGTGITGDLNWDDYTLTFTMPADCYEVYVDSRDMGPGEFVFQEFVLSPGSTARRSDIYAASGSFTATLEIPHEAEPIANLHFIPLKVGVIGENISGIMYRAGDSANGPWQAWTSNPASLPESLVYQVTGSFTNATPPVIYPESPSVDYLRTLAREHHPVLTRANRSEFPGVIAVSNLQVSSSPARHFVTTLSSGRVYRKAFGDKVGRLSGFRLLAFREEAIAELEETCLEQDFIIEARGRLYTVRFKDQIIFKAEPASSYGSALAERYMYATADIGAVEVVKVEPHVGAEVYA